MKRVKSGVRNGFRSMFRRQAQPQIDGKEGTAELGDMKEEKLESRESEAMKHPHPYAAMLGVFDDNIEDIVSAYGRQKTDISREMENAYILAGGKSDEAEPKRKYLSKCLENSVIPHDVYAAKCVGLWKAVARKYRTEKVAHMSMIDLLKADPITVTNWLREIVPPARKHRIFGAILADSDELKVGKYDKDGKMTLYNESEDDMNFTLAFKSLKFFAYPSTGKIKPHGEAVIIVTRLVNSRTRGKITLTVGEMSKDIPIELAQTDQQEDESEKVNTKAKSDGDHMDKSETKMKEKKEGEESGKLKADETKADVNDEEKNKVDDMQTKKSTKSQKTVTKCKRDGTMDVEEKVEKVVEKDQDKTRSNKKGAQNKKAKTDKKDAGDKKE